ncbi:unnamed protein product, partial [Ixodes persulcatus]
LLVVFAAWVHRSRKHKASRKSFPPGPWGLPLVGYLPFLRRKQHVVFRDLAHKYGPVFSVRLGVVNVVILNSYESVQEAFSKKQLLARTPKLFLTQAGGVLNFSGFMTLNGKSWIDNRKYCLHLINSPAYGQKDMETQEEIVYLAEKISEVRGCPIPIEKYLLPSLSNNVTALVFGQRYDFDDPRRNMLDDILDTGMRCLAAGAVITFMPRGFRTLTTACFTRFGALRPLVQKLTNFMRTLICCFLDVAKAYDRPFEPQVNNFIDGYLQLMSEHKTDPNTSFNMPNLIGNALAVFAAGSQTTCTTLLWSLLSLADKADTVQRKVQEEIDRATEGRRAPAWSDRHDMPYTMATVWETQRWRTLSVMGIPRE